MDPEKIDVQQIIMYIFSFIQDICERSKCRLKSDTNNLLPLTRKINNQTKQNFPPPKPPKNKTLNELWVCHNKEERREVIFLQIWHSLSVVQLFLLMFLNV